ncbi:MAG: hypothetical protein C5B50_19985 [Verrucomicrobia bacterium]|nr:MAG: hypothetical protein C5B50_19985 [Verrucomicrobiota bacterium]
MPRSTEVKQRSVFLNVPFDKSYERLFVALIGGLISLGQAPHCVLELPEIGQGRLDRILRLIQACQISIHDLSRVGHPARFNMPFELGIAVALARYGGRHQFVVLEAERHRLSRTLSDLSGIDPGIHGASAIGIISCLISHLGLPTGNPSIAQVKALDRRLWRAANILKRDYRRDDLYSRAIFQGLVQAGLDLARGMDLVLD